MSSPLRDGDPAPPPLLLDPLLGYLNTRRKDGDDADGPPSPPDGRIDVDAAVSDLTTKGYHVVRSVLTGDECDAALGRLWDFVEDVSGGCVARSDPRSWYPLHQCRTADGRPVKLRAGSEDEDASPIICRDPGVEGGDVDPWPHTGYGSFPDMFQSLGAGFVLGDVREILAERVYGPLFGTDDLATSKEGFTFCRPLVVDDEGGGGGGGLVWDPYGESREGSDGGDNRRRPLFRVCGRDQPNSEGQHFDQGVPACAVPSNGIGPAAGEKADAGESRRRKKREDRRRAKTERFRELAGLCHVQASVSFTDQSADRDRGGGHFLVHAGSHGSHADLVGGTYRATSGGEKEGRRPTWVPLTDGEITRLEGAGHGAARVYAGRGDVVLWRSDAAHAGVAPSLSVLDQGGKTAYDGPRGFRAVGYCAMLPRRAVEDYLLYCLPRHRVTRWEDGRGRVFDKEAADRLAKARAEELSLARLEAYRCGRTGDHRPEAEEWHEHRRTTVWNASRAPGLPYPPRLLQRPRGRLGQPELTAGLARLYGLLPRNSTEDDARRAVVRGVNLVEDAYVPRRRCGEAVGPWAVRDGRYSEDEGGGTEGGGRIPICLASLEKLVPTSAGGAPEPLSGQDKWLGGMSSPCGRYVYGVPGHARRVVRVDTSTSEVDFIGPEFPGEFKWLRGVEVPPSPDGSPGCCLALPCCAEGGRVLKIEPHTSRVTAFAAEEAGDDDGSGGGWLYHGGNLGTDGHVYAVPACARRVLRIDPRRETAAHVGPRFDGDAKWYGSLMGSDSCIYGIPHNATGVLKINPATQEVRVLEEGRFEEGSWKWHGGLASHDGRKIIGFPNNADTVLVIDVEAQRIYTVGDGSVLRSGGHRVPYDGRYKYLGGALTRDGRYAYLFPCDAERVLRFDMRTDELALVGPRLREGPNKFQNGFCGRDGCVYGIPQTSSGVLRIVPPGVERYDGYGNPLPSDSEHVDVMYCGDDVVACKDKMEGGVLGADGRIYCIPLRAKQFVSVLPRDKVTS